MSETDKIRPTLGVMISGAYVTGGKIFVPQVLWKKDFQGQVTDGRIGTPYIGLAPIDWLPLGEQDKIRSALIQGQKL